MEKEQKPQPDPDSKAAEPTTEQAAIKPPTKKTDASASRWQRFRQWYSSHKKWSIPATATLVLLVLAAVPWSRYTVAGLVIKKDLTVEIMDYTSRRPVSGATVSAGSISSQTDASGRAALHLRTGNHSVLISKKYYQDQRVSILVPIFRQKPAPVLSLTATGRQVKITVKNIISQLALAGVDIKAAGTSEKTDKNGEAIMVLPAGESEQKATLELAGYNSIDTTVKVSDSSVIENVFTLTPVGKIYYLNENKGKIDVVKANLDGSNVQVVVAATGRERDYDTLLLPSADWKYILLVARRTSEYPTAQMHVLSTEDDKLLGVDNGNADFYPVGWAGSNLIYYSSRGDLPDYQTGKNKLKSYNASTGKIALLDQTSAVGDSNASYYENYAFISLAGENVYYAKNWSSSDEFPDDALVEGKKNSFSVISTGGQGHKELSSYSALDYIRYAHLSPDRFYIWQQAGSSDKFFEYQVGATALKTSTSIDAASFYDYGEIFFPSPSGKKMLWVEHLDGKHSILVSNIDGQNSASIASASKYIPYGWSSDDYILITKDSGELNIMSAGGGNMFKITDSHHTLFSTY